MQKLTFFLLIIALSCNSKTDYKKPENALEAGREFIDNSLKGRYNTAKKYMLQDQENIYWLDKVSKLHNELSEQEKAGLSQASIKINEVAYVSDSITVINYSNSYKKRSQKVKVVKHKGEWVVDFKYTFSGNL